MTEIKKRITALSLAATLLLGTTGCSKNEIKRNVDENNNIIYEGEISHKNLDNLFIVEIEKIDGNTDIYLTKRSLQEINDNGFYEYELLGTTIEIANSYKYESSYGRVINITNFEQFVPLYDEINDMYTAEEIINIFNNVKKDYSVLLKNKNIMKKVLNKKEV